MKKYTVRVHRDLYTEFEVEAKDRFDAYLMVKNKPSECNVVGGGESTVINSCDIFETPDYSKMQDLIETENDSKQLELFSKSASDNK